MIMRAVPSIQTYKSKAKGYLYVNALGGGDLLPLSYDTCVVAAPAKQNKTEQTVPPRIEGMEEYP